jgi:predicted membrane chloride channel (bestrophin family)
MVWPSVFSPSSRAAASWQRHSKALKASPEQPTVSKQEAILFPERLQALRACDSNGVSYDPNSFLMVFRLRGRNFKMMVPPLVAFLVWDVACILILDALQVQEDVLVLETLVEPLLLPVSFLLVFRLGRAAIRFWDARAAVGKLVEICRTFISTAAAAEHSQNDLDELARWVCAFPIAVKNFLRPSNRTGWDQDMLLYKHRCEIGPLLSDEEAAAVLNTQKGEIGTIFVLNRLRQLTYKISMSMENNQLSSILYHRLNEHIDILTGAWGAMERINSSPLPFVYVVHLRTFLIVYLLLWHLLMVATSGWVAVFPLMIASWALLGIEAAAVECERPFEWQSNHLALGKMCVVVSQNVAQTIRDKNNHGMGKGKTLLVSTMPHPTQSVGSED